MSKQLNRIARTYSPPWVLFHCLGFYVAALPAPGFIRLLYARNLDELARQLRAADLRRPATMAVYRRELRVEEVHERGQ